MFFQSFWKASYSGEKQAPQCGWGIKPVWISLNDIQLIFMVNHHHHRCLRPSSSLHLPAEWSCSPSPPPPPPPFLCHWFFCQQSDPPKIHKDQKWNLHTAEASTCVTPTALCVCAWFWSLNNPPELYSGCSSLQSTCSHSNTYCLLLNLMKYEVSECVLQLAPLWATPVWPSAPSASSNAASPFLPSLRHPFSLLHNHNCAISQNFHYICGLQN